MAALLSRSTLLSKLKPLLSMSRHMEMTNHLTLRNNPCPRGMHTVQAQANVLACNIYVSEGHDRGALQAMQDSLNQIPGVHTAHVFVDVPYHRTGFTLTSLSTDQLVAGALALSQTAFSLIDLRNHKAKHPRLGALDHISIHHLGTHSLPTSASSSQPPSSTPEVCQPSGQENLQGLPDASSHYHQASVSHPFVGSRWSENGVNEKASPGSGDLSSCVARVVGHALAGPPFGLPVYYYGNAHPQRRRLADVRRGLGYFKGSNAQRASTPAGSAQGAGKANRSGHDSSSHATNAAPEWQGSLPMPHLSHFPPDEGPLELNPQHGLVTIGSVPWVVNYNVPVTLQAAEGSRSPRTAGAAEVRQQGAGESGGGAPGIGNVGTSELLQLAKVLARGVSERGGGLRLVESMALAHEDGIVEVACNLLGGGEGVAPSEVQVYIEELADTLNEGAVKLIVGQGYQTGLSPQQLVQQTMHALAS